MTSMTTSRTVPGISAVRFHHGSSTRTTHMTRRLPLGVIPSLRTVIFQKKKRQAQNKPNDRAEHTCITTCQKIGGNRAATREDPPRPTRRRGAMLDADRPRVSKEQILRGVLRMGPAHRRTRHRSRRPRTQSADKPVPLPQSMASSHDA